MKKYTREKVVELLTERDVEVTDRFSLFEVFREGCTGWTNRNNRELIEFFILYILEPDNSINDFIFVTEDNKELKVVPLGEEDFGGTGLKIDNVVDDYQYI